MSKLISTNPADNYFVVGQVTISSSSEITEKVNRARKAKLSWKELGVKERVKFLRPIADEFEKQEEEIADLITKETGKPTTQTHAEAKGYVEELRWFLDNVETALKEEITYEDKKSVHKIIFEPIGVVAVIAPWNFPFGVAVWGIFQNLLVGNTVVFKISEECPLLGKLVEDIISNYSLPTGVFAEIYGAGDVGEKLSKSDVDLIWFTGSTKTGKSLYKTAADKFIKVVLELGGSNPGIVFEDVDVKKAAVIMADARLFNCGQDCSAVKRLIVHEKIFDEFISELKEVYEAKGVGDPTNKKTDLGSLVAKRQVDLLKGQVDDSLKKGAKVIYEAELSKNLKGAFYPPTILGNIKKQMRVWREEVFGPVLPVVTFKTEQEAIELANSTSYGLGSRVISKDKDRIQRVSSKLEAGTVEVNEGERWLPCNPFGGYKNSGMGVEHGILGFRELSQVKVISSSK